MSEAWTIGRLLAWASEHLQQKEVSAPRLSAQLMLAAALDCSRLDLFLRHDQPLAEDELAAFKRLLLRRREHEPLAYILGRREFYGLELQVGPGCLVPRPESEHLVEQAAKRLAEMPAPRVLDLCTGCGAVALALARELPAAQVVAVDISAKALGYARTSAAELGLDGRVSWLKGDLYDPLAASGGFFEAITANPPYVASAEMAALPREVRDYEPAEALDGGPDGLAFSGRIIAGSRAFLRPHGWLLVELGAGQGEAASRLASQAGIFQSVETAPDLAGHQRVLICQRGDYG